MGRPKKIPLTEAVEKSKTPRYITIGALSKAGLLKQYRENDKKTLITIPELEKIIKEFKGD